MSGSGGARNVKMLQRCASEGELEDDAPSSSDARMKSGQIGGLRVASGRGPPSQPARGWEKLMAATAIKD